VTLFIALTLFYKVKVIKVKRNDFKVGSWQASKASETLYV